MPQGQILDFARPLPFTVENCKMQFLIPFALEQSMFAIMRFQPHPKLLQKLDGVVISAVAFGENPVDMEVIESDVQQGRDCLICKALPRKSRIDTETYLALTGSCVGPVQ